MPRIARVVAPGFPHHITQRGNRRLQTFFNDADYQAYINFMAHWCSQFSVDIWAYCLMPNHSHLIAVPNNTNSLHRAIGEAHRRYTCRINERMGWKGHLWQGRFSSFPMDEEYLLVAARYIEMNPVRAGLTGIAESYSWSSARAHMSGINDKLVKVEPLLNLVQDWKGFISGRIHTYKQEKLIRHEQTGRPLGNDRYLKKLEEKLGRKFRQEKRGPIRRVFNNLVWCPPGNEKV